MILSCKKEGYCCLKYELLMDCDLALASHGTSQHKEQCFVYKFLWKESDIAMRNLHRLLALESITKPHFLKLYSRLAFFVDNSVDSFLTLDPIVKYTLNWPWLFGFGIQGAETTLFEFFSGQLWKTGQPLLRTTRVSNVYFSIAKEYLAMTKYDFSVRNEMKASQISLWEISRENGTRMLDEWDLLVVTSRLVNYFFVNFLECQYI